MQNVHKKIETAANVAIILVAVLLGGLLINRYFFNPAPTVPPASAQDSVKVGTKLPLTDVDWTKSEKNLVMILSTTCRYCKESTPFYQKLSEFKAGNPNVRIIAVMPQSLDEAKQYLAEQNISVDEIKAIKPQEMFVRGTPTLVLVDRGGAAVESWVGKLPAEKEKDVISHL